MKLHCEAEIMLLTAAFFRNEKGLDDMTGLSKQNPKSYILRNSLEKWANLPAKIKLEPKPTSMTALQAPYSPRPRVKTEQKCNCPLLSSLSICPRQRLQTGKQHLENLPCSYDGGNRAQLSENSLLQFPLGFDSSNSLKTEENLFQRNQPAGLLSCLPVNLSFLDLDSI